MPDGRTETSSEQRHGGVPDERVGERQRIRVRPKRVRLPPLERLVEERMAVPGDQVGREQRVAEILRHVAVEMEHERPEHHDRQRDTDDDYDPALAGGRRRGLGAQDRATLTRPHARISRGESSSSRIARPAPVGACLRAVAADLHRAPRAAPVTGVVEEGPAAVVPRARFQARPAAGGLGLVDDGQ